MALKQRLNDDLKAALLERRRFESDILRTVKAAILDQEIATNQRQDGLSDIEVESVLQREVKKRRESKALYEQNNRPDLAQNEQQEIDILSRYLPEPISESQIQSAIAEIILQVDTGDKQVIGKIISQVKAKFGSAADGALVARLVKDSLQKQESQE